MERASNTAADGAILGIDIGGTFTDCIAITPERDVRIGKAFSTPPDFHAGFIASIEAVARSLQTDAAGLLAGAAGVYHGCTVGTNALVEGRTARVGLLTTRGHRDAIYVMKAGRRLQGMDHEYVSNVAAQGKPEPLVPRALVREVDERVTRDGDVLVEIDDEQVRAAVRELLDEGVEAFVVSLLWSVANPANEERVAAIVRELAPDAFVSVASRVMLRTGEYERTVAAVVNGLIGPEMERYLAVLEQRCAALGYRGRVHIMTCSGGLISTDEARALPVLTIGSGPVAGLIGSREVAARAGAGQPDVITADMGGTTFDVGVVHRGVALSRRTSWHGQYEYFVPTLDVRSVGSGGGSIIRHDHEMGTLRVGPESAAAVPGPVCLGRGGTEPTVTDANLVAGILDPEYFLGGRVRLDVAAARAALARAGEPLGLSAEETAAAALRIVDNQMADAIRLASVQQGLDPRRFALYAYGGAGPVHGAAVATHVGISDVVVPLSDLAAAWSALGIAGAEPLVVQEGARALNSPFDPAAIDAAFAELEDDVVARMARQGIARDRLTLTRHADLRYSLQVNQVEVDAPDGAFDAQAVDELVERFEREYERLFGAGAGYAAAGFTITGLRVRCRAAARQHPATQAAEPSVAAPAQAEPHAHRDVIVYARGLAPERVAIYRSDALRPGVRIAGPAIIELPDTTVVVPHAGDARLDEHGSVHIALEGSR